MEEFFTAAGFGAFLKVIMVDLVLAGDNAVVIGLAAAGVSSRQRNRAIIVGILAATVLRIVFALAATVLLNVIGLLLVGGLLLLWVCWKMWGELQVEQTVPVLEPAVAGGPGGSCEVAEAKPEKSFGQAVSQIVIADVSMSLDNVLAVAGAAREHPTIMVFGLIVSIALMGLAASFIAKLLGKHRWIAYIGLAVIVYVAIEMVYRGSSEIWSYASALA